MKTIRSDLELTDFWESIGTARILNLNPRFGALLPATKLISILFVVDVIFLFARYFFDNFPQNLPNSVPSDESNDEIIGGFQIGLKIFYL